MYDYKLGENNLVFYNWLVSHKVIPLDSTLAVQARDIWKLGCDDQYNQKLIAPTSEALKHAEQQLLSGKEFDIFCLLVLNYRDCEQSGGHLLVLLFSKTHGTLKVVDPKTILVNKKYIVTLRDYLKETTTDLIEFLEQFTSEKVIFEMPPKMTLDFIQITNPPVMAEAYPVFLINAVLKMIEYPELDFTEASRLVGEMSKSEIMANYQAYAVAYEKFLSSKNCLFNTETEQCDETITKYLESPTDNFHYGKSMIRNELGFNPADERTFKSKILAYAYFLNKFEHSYFNLPDEETWEEVDMFDIMIDWDVVLSNPAIDEPADLQIEDENGVSYTRRLDIPLSVERSIRVLNKCDDVKLVFIYMSLTKRCPPEKGECSTHANMLIVNKITKTIERWEPWGSESPARYDVDLLDSLLNEYFEKMLPEYSYVTSLEFCPVGRNFQRIKGGLYVEDNDLLRGQCSLWAWWFVNLRCTNISKDPSELAQLADKAIKSMHEPTKFLYDWKRAVNVEIEDLEQLDYDYFRSYILERVCQSPQAATACDKWTENSSINPLSGRRIKREADLYRLLAGTCEASNGCEAFSQTNLNPASGRKLKEGSRRYNFLTRLCQLPSQK